MLLASISAQTLQMLASELTRLTAVCLSCVYSEIHLLLIISVFGHYV